MEIGKLIKQAILEKNNSAKEAYRAIKAELLLNASSKNPKPEGEALEVSIIRKLIKQREESIAIYKLNHRNDLADIEKEQVKYLKELLPPEISDDKIVEFITTSYPNGFTQKEMGKVIKKVKATYPTADGKKISELVKSYIQ